MDNIISPQPRRLHDITSRESPRRLRVNSPSWLRPSSKNPSEAGTHATTRSSRSSLDVENLPLTSHNKCRFWIAHISSCIRLPPLQKEETVSEEKMEPVYSATNLRKMISSSYRSGTLELSRMYLETSANDAKESGSDDEFDALSMLCLANGFGGDSDSEQDKKGRASPKGVLTLSNAVQNLSLRPFSRLGPLRTTSPVARSNSPTRLPVDRPHSSLRSKVLSRRAATRILEDLARATTPTPSHPYPPGLEPDEEAPFDAPPCDLTHSVTDISTMPVTYGGFSSIYSGNYFGGKVAVKVLRLSDGVKIETIRRRLQREMKVWWKLDHPNIVPLHGVITNLDAGRMEAMVTPWYEFGSAVTYLSSNDAGFMERLKLLDDVARGLEYLHSYTPVLVHGDLKPGNILIDNMGKARICDFGLVRIIGQEAGRGYTTTTPHLGTARYSAPELILIEESDYSAYTPTTQSDIYAFGCVALEFTAKQIPFAHRGANATVQVIADVIKGVPPAERPITLTVYEERLWDLFESCWGLSILRPGITAAIEILNDIQKCYEATT